MDPTMPLTQVPVDLGKLNEADATLAPMSTGPTNFEALGAKFHALMGGAEGAGKPTAPDETASVSGSVIGDALDAQDTALSQAFSDVNRLSASADSVPVNELMTEAIGVSTEMQLSFFRLQIAASAEQNVKTATEELMKNQ